MAEMENKGFHLIRDVNVKSVARIFFIQEGRYFSVLSSKTEWLKKHSFGFIFTQQLFTKMGQSWTQYLSTKEVLPSKNSQILNKEKAWFSRSEWILRMLVSYELKHNTKK